MLRNVCLAIMLLSLAGCSGQLIDAVSHPDIIITSNTDLTVLTLEEYNGKYQIVTPDTTIRMDGELPAGMLGVWPTNAELAELGVRELPTR